MVEQVHIVVVRGDNMEDVLCYTDRGQPAVYLDASSAELRAAELRERSTGSEYAVKSPQVL